MVTNQDGKRIVARWESKGKDYIELAHDGLEKFPNSYSYKGTNCGGGLLAESDEDAILQMEKGGCGPAWALKVDRPSTKRTI